MILFRNGQICAQGEEIIQDVKMTAGEVLRLCLLVLPEEGEEAGPGGKAVFNIDIEGPGADLSLNGLYVCKGNSRVKVSVNLNHKAGGSRSFQQFRGVVSGSSRSVFDGKITVSPDAQKTEAYQTNRNLQLSEDAVVETSPQLEIYADDVKCSHGATVGTLDEDEQFYMRSRGISLEEARRLQVISFLSPVMADLDSEMKDHVLKFI